jgi:hypothetical protein
MVYSLAQEIILVFRVRNDYGKGKHERRRPKQLERVSGSMGVKSIWNQQKFGVRKGEVCHLPDDFDGMALM